MKIKIRSRFHKTVSIYIFNYFMVLDQNLKKNILAFDLLNKGMTNYHLRSESLIKANHSKGWDAKPLA